MLLNPPKSIVSGDFKKWISTLPEYPPTEWQLSWAIRGESVLDLVASPYDGNYQTQISSTQSANLLPGTYSWQAMVTRGNERTTIATGSIMVIQDLARASTGFEARFSDEIELELLTKAIAELSSKNVAEYYIGTRKVRYNDLASLYERQKYLRNRIAKLKNKSSIGGRNVGVSFRS
ncbi:hypothetical protein [Pleurocapsa sp. FMAR1]|uniref:hypothetical protein n=1 Tax=Pleurocapsa sp. FMAR1 TaxID=3040204 RepID=UPI0029C65225|nr:hypothetical protein [Pleurocapsa sp. FMAR1]